jgi:hypothetical protein
MVYGRGWSHGLRRNLPLKLLIENSLLCLIFCLDYMAVSIIVSYCNKVGLGLHACMVVVICQRGFLEYTGQ